MAVNYYGFGLCFRSDLPLLDLGTVATATDMPTVEIRLGAVEPCLPAPLSEGACFQVGDQDFLLAVPNVARYRVRRGCEIVVEPFAGAADRDIRVFLLGTILGALCHQRGLLPLHASAIAVDGRCIVFTGPSRAGKSTLAAFLAGRGYAILSDDICVVSRDPAGRPLAWPGVSRPKLWRDAVDALKISPGAIEPTRHGMEKYYVTTEVGHRDVVPLPLSRIYILREARSAAQEGVERLRGARAVLAMMGATYRRNLLKPMNGAKAHFTQLTAVVQHAQINLAQRRWGFDALAADAEKLERHFREAC